MLKLCTVICFVYISLHSNTTPFTHVKHHSSSNDWCSSENHFNSYNKPQSLMYSFNGRVLYVIFFKSGIYSISMPTNFSDRLQRSSKADLKRPVTTRLPV